jgi:alkyl hydroperoxide reductase subunit F
MYTKVECIWCDRAKNILDEYELEYLEIDISDDIIRKKFYQEVGEGVSTVPQVYINDERIGGYKELSEWLMTNGKK